MHQHLDWVKQAKDIDEIRSYVHSLLARGAVYRKKSKEPTPNPRANLRSPAMHLVHLTEHPPNL